ncbi:nucleotidyltransferase domain-containing protein [Shouchella patagoniensis]|uniref:nucleotidyltransferase domain-containing protein n=1 Tax=Shouchella patagoniensis TaxID=228576 RepID=UPI0009951B63|nr:nucleotidyltransferase domain-containing protein [Shouchella patagoniensis]
MTHLRAGYGLDADGFIISDVGLDKIDQAYLLCIQDSAEKLATLFPHQLHSVYVYGSVARGEAVVIKSDLDLLVLFNETLTTEELTELKTLTSALSQDYQSLVRDVGIAVAYYDYVVDPENYDEQAFIKELCVCIHGEDIRTRFGPYKLTSEIAIRFNGDIREVLARTIIQLKSASTEEHHIRVQGFARKLIRTYYSMVMARSQIWTTRLNEQADVFLHYYPLKKSVIRTLLTWIEEPPTDREQILALFQSEGEWASLNFEQEARVTS